MELTAAGSGLAEIVCTGTLRGFQDSLPSSPASGGLRRVIRELHGLYVWTVEEDRSVEKEVEEEEVDGQSGGGG